MNDIKQFDVTELPGFETRFASKFKKAGVETTADLLEQGNDRKLRELLEEKTGIKHDTLLHLVHKADFCRLEDVGPDEAALLDAVGVKSVLQLAHRNPAHLHAAIRSYLDAHPRETDAKQRRGEKRLPSMDTCMKWVEEAKRAPSIVDLTFTEEVSG